MSNIEWTDVTWNPVIGCTPVSPGCLNCYAATMARRLEVMRKRDYTPRHQPYSEEVAPGAFVHSISGNIIRIAEVRNGRAVFTGDVRTLEHRLREPLRWKKPRRVFVNSMSDLFHESVPFEFICRVYAVMALCPQHTFQVLTKRPERMAEYFAQTVSAFDGAIRQPKAWEMMCRAMRSIQPSAELTDATPWPLPNVWHGTSAEDQARLDERVPNLLRCPAAVRFLSLEPLLGPVDLNRICIKKSDGHQSELGKPNVTIDALRGWHIGAGDDRARIHWVIVGGESGPWARPCRLSDIESVVEQCRHAGVACFVKQLGSRPVFPPFTEHSEPTVGKWYEPTVGDDFDTRRVRNRKGADPSEWPEHIRVRQMPEGR